MVAGVGVGCGRATAARRWLPGAADPRVNRRVFRRAVWPGRTRLGAALAQGHILSLLPLRLLRANLDVVREDHLPLAPAGHRDHRKFGAIGAWDRRRSKWHQHLGAEREVSV